jgi:D-glycero-D-manno-heptose 1,7-bisphosphate phosphatase
MVGDKSSDIECGQRAGARTILVRTGYGAQQSCQPDYTVEDAVKAASIILR